MDGFQHKKWRELMTLYPPALVSLAWGWDSIPNTAYKYITVQAYISHIEQTLHVESVLPSQVKVREH